jgi:ribonuclease VapC
MALPVRVLDSWAIIAFLEDEPAAHQVENIIIEALQTNSRLLIPVVNLGEVWYSIARALSIEAADKAINQIRSLGVDIIDVDWSFTYQAAQFKMQGNIAYADCFALALAFQEEAELITGDQEFKQFEKLIKIVWL